MIYRILIFSIFLNCGCNYATHHSSSDETNEVTTFVKTTTPKEYATFSRAEIEARLKKKLEDKLPLVLHVFVPLCDNENQGIVPVPAKLGDGMDARNNLYWGALYGVKTHLTKKGWKKVRAEENPNPEILERVVFEKKMSNGAFVYVVADAYRGDKMKKCVIDYLEALAGKEKESIALPNDLIIGAKGKADLLIFNGHNGLMDYNISPIKNEDGIAKDAAVIGCVSFDYFEEHLKAAKGFPLVTTTNLMAPEAYILNAIAHSWGQLEEGVAIKEAVAQAYNEYQKCGIKGARRLFKTGW